jgi:16S rRNA (cytidine1402-2'-O)-methyltransferase
VKGTLYIVSTPIGNLEDITLRALRVLKEVDIIAAEDTRHSQKLLNHYSIAKPLISYWGEREKVRSEELIQRLNAGESAALISDAGTPGISDPGTVLIRKAIQEGIDVIPVPGPTAFVSALSISGFSTEEFIFLGFLPPKQSQRRKALKELSFEMRTLVLYEAPHRIVQTIADMKKVFGSRQVMVAKEITKLFEVVIRGTLSEILDHIEGSKIAGEYVIVVEGRTEKEFSHIDDAMLEVSALLKKGMRRKDAARKVAEEYGFSKKELYDRSLSFDKEPEQDT